MGERDTENFKTVIITKGDSGLGFNILGGSDRGSAIFVSHIVPKGAADGDGMLKKGDMFIAINGLNVEQATHEEAVALLKKSVGSVKLVVRPNLKEFTKVQKAAESLAR